MVKKKNSIQQETVCVCGIYLERLCVCNDTHLYAAEPSGKRSNLH